MMLDCLRQEGKLACVLLTAGKQLCTVITQNLSKQTALAFNLPQFMTFVVCQEEALPPNWLLTQ